VSGPRRRLDAVLVERGLAETRAQAQALVMAGRVAVDGAAATKAGTPVRAGAAVEVSRPPRYVSRGGEKLETALAHFGVDPAGERCLDVGASTGGFTDCLLQHGAAAVVALDVGRAQLHERVAADPRVTVIDGVNARHLEPAMLPSRPGLVTVDVSFIPLRLVLPAVLACAAPGWRALVLVKPQFEAGPADVGKGGVVRDPDVHLRVLREVVARVPEWGGRVVGVTDSGLLGPKGNREFFLLIEAGPGPGTVDDARIDAVVG
jgi:23S rRNA (cytidine1920-2'-O)/16S rRNA (cytidine1409-2'-O)-methyltransferase